MNDRWIYADYSATAPLDPDVLEVMLPWLRGLAANASSVHGPGRRARKAIEEARSSVARALGAEPSEIVFTSGGTESNNLAVTGAARAVRRESPARTRIAISAVEHPAVREPARALSGEGFLLTELPVNADSTVEGEAARRFLGGEGAGTVALLSIMLANNETGSINTGIESLFRAAREGGARVHCDAVQAVGKLEIDVKALGADLLALTAHKFGGPKGCGALFVRGGVKVEPLIRGGAQEKGRRGGTEDVAGIVGLAAALSKAQRTLDEESRRLASLRDRFEMEVRRLWPEARINAGGSVRLPGVSSVTFKGLDAEMLVIALDLEGVAVSTGAACSTGTVSASRALLACGLPPDEVRSTVRFSLGRESTEQDVDGILTRLSAILTRMRGRIPA